jgi:uncharacterized membrane protein
MNKDNDPKHWKLGIFYYNPDNLSESVDKRNGIGTTINFASKLGRRIVAFLFVPAILVIVVFIIAGFLSR